MIRPGPMRRRRFLIRRRRAAARRRPYVTWLDRLQVLLTFLVVLSWAVAAAGYFSAQHLQREMLIELRMDARSEEV